MRIFGRLFAVVVVTAAGCLPCLAQQPGSATLENLVNSPEAQGTPVAAEVADAALKRSAGTVARPKDGVKHPSLDKAWAEYDAVVGKAAEEIKAAITMQFDAATEDGDLDAAVKWQTALEKFEKAGEMPADSDARSKGSSVDKRYCENRAKVAGIIKAVISETKSKGDLATAEKWQAALGRFLTADELPAGLRIKVAVFDSKTAQDELANAYDSVVKALTMEKKIVAAKAVSKEWQSLFAQPDDTATLEDSATGSEPAKVSGLARPSGTLSRPQGGVKHPDLDKSWAKYDAALVKAAEGIKAAMMSQFDAATARGDLGAAEKWQAALEKFEKAGRLPAEAETKAAVSAAVSELKKARGELAKAYEATVTALTMEKKIAQAKTVRAESVAIIGGQAYEDADSRERRPEDDFENRLRMLFIGQWRFENGNVEEIAPGGDYLINGSRLDPWGGSWRLDISDPMRPCVVRHANNGTLTRWYIDPDKPTVLISEKGGKITRIGPPPAKSR